MQFPGYWVSEDNGKIVFQATAFDETELDPATDWKEAWQNQDEAALIKGFVKLPDALSHAAHLIAQMQGLDLSDAQINAMMETPQLFKNGKCELRGMDDFRQMCFVLNSILGMQPAPAPVRSIELPEALEEIPFN